MSERQCSPCTACCEGWLTADINGVKMKPGRPCGHLAADGCGIYPDRPADPCAKFLCGWIQEPERIPEFMKPSESGVIMLFPEMLGRKVISAVPAGEEIREDVLEWLKSFAVENSIPLVFSRRIVRDGRFTGIKRTGFGPPSFIEAVKMRLGPEDIMKF